MLRLKLLSVGVIACCVSSASATLVHFEGMGLARNLSFTYLPAPGDPPQAQSANAGQIKIRLGEAPEMLLAYCLDVEHAVKSPWTASLQPVTSLGPRGPQVAYLYETFGPTVDSKNKAAALQAAIWETLYDGDTDLSAGRFFLRTNSGGNLFKQAQQYLLSIPTSYTPSRSTVVLRSGDYPRSEDLIVPESMPLILLAFGSLPLLIRRPLPQDAKSRLNSGCYPPDR